MTPVGLDRIEVVLEGIKLFACLGVMVAGGWGLWTCRRILQEIDADLARWKREGRG